MFSVAFSGYACNGKSTLVNSLNFNLEIYGNMTPVIIPEHVELTYEIFNYIDNIFLTVTDKNIENHTRKSAFDCIRTRQLGLINSVIHELLAIYRIYNKFEMDGIINKSKSKPVFIYDRTIIDYFIFTILAAKCLKEKSEKDYNSVLNKITEIFDSMEDIFETLYNLNNKRHIYNLVYFIDIPDDNTIIENCFDRELRKQTLDINKFKQDAVMFKKLYLDLVENSSIIRKYLINDFVVIPSPINNNITTDIINDVINIINTTVKL